MKKFAKVMAGLLCLCVVFLGIVWFSPVTSANISPNGETGPVFTLNGGNAKQDFLSDGADSHYGFGVLTEGHTVPASHTTAKPHIYYQNKVVVVTFHDISPTTYSDFVITPKAFSADLDAFEQSFNVITNRQFIDFLSGRTSVPPNAVLLTFDDGYQNMYTYALPILVKHHMQGTFFDIVSTADTKHQTEFLTWDEIKAMTADGMCIESHTYRLHREIHTPSGFPVTVFNTRIAVSGVYETPGQYYHRVYGDFLRAREELSLHTGVSVNEFAWPYGHGTLMAVYIAHEAGYEYLFTTRNGVVTAHSNPLQIHRIDVGVAEESPTRAVQDVIAIANRPPQIYRALHHVTKDMFKRWNQQL